MKILSSSLTAVKELKRRKNDISIKNNPKNTDSCWLNYFRTGSLSARYPQIKNSNDASLEIEIMLFIIFNISYYVSSYPFWYCISLNNSFKKINMKKNPKKNSKISDVVVKFIKTLSLS